MGWIEGLNDAMDYIERSLEGDLDVAHAARFAACTEGQFRRMFSYVAGIGLGEYVRRRRISCAALDLSRGERVVDVAVRYGYGSPTAFTRAFREALGVSPSEAKRPGARLSLFPRLSFSLTVTGTEPLSWRIVPWGGMRLVGVSLPCGSPGEEPLAQMGDEGREALRRFWGGASCAGSIEGLLVLSDGSGPGESSGLTCRRAGSRATG
ncbi:helix-turn-helix domain-containing protein [Candidatus Collinsella stercoripullorum]|uniref:helix-turn-helix domain-containing protein n=1 Tax=Candidatus Collinsella stercoripullorum TaxID=2838522 RepID=UPI0022E7441A|nr:AraC family transcriptional regulator [Candidatus Collinsella stercoripullorum]